MKQFQPGDVIEVKLPGGFAYVQITHNHPAYPEVIRALPGYYKKPPENILELASGQSVFTVMLPLFSAIERGMLEGRKVTSTKVPSSDSTFPTFRIPIRDRQGNVVYWWFWDGEGLNYDAKPDAGSENMPLREITTTDTFIERLSATAPC